MNDAWITYCRLPMNWPCFMLSMEYAYARKSPTAENRD